MGNRPPIKTKIGDAIEYWSKSISELDFNIDWSEGATHCWRCGCKSNLQRCHIIPYSLGGLDQPDNIVLLCTRCHAENPNLRDKTIMWDWIKAYKVQFYDTFWLNLGLKEYEFIYQTNFLSDMNLILDVEEKNEDLEAISNEIKLTIREYATNASVHFGQNYFNAATVAGLLRLTLIRLASARNRDISHISNNSTRKRWYYI